MIRIQLDLHLPGNCWSSARRAVGILRIATVVPIATCLVAPESALANSAVDATFHPNLLLYGWFIALVFLGFGFLTSRRAICDRRVATAVAQWPTTIGTVIAADVTERVHEAEISFCYFVPQVRYEYEAYGVRRQGDLIRIGLDDTGYRKRKMHVITLRSIRPGRQLLCTTIRKIQNRRCWKSGRWASIV